MTTPTSFPLGVQLFLQENDDAPLVFAFELRDAPALSEVLSEMLDLGRNNVGSSVHAYSAGKPIRPNAFGVGTLTIQWVKTSHKDVARWRFGDEVPAPSRAPRGWEFVDTSVPEDELEPATHFDAGFMGLPC